MRIPDDILHCPVFLGFNEVYGDLGTLKYAGTGFLVVMTTDNLKLSFNYLVTAHHIADFIRKQPQPIAWLGHPSGKFWHIALDEAQAPWHYPEDQSVDLAACRLVPPESGYIGLVPEDFVLDKHFGQEGIGIGDEVFSVSLFGFSGKRFTASPLVRVGNLAMITTERISFKKYGAAEVYLIEARSIGGMSGAPVFVSETKELKVPGVDPNGKQITMQLKAQGSFGLLGVVHGHWEIDKSDLNLALPAAVEREGVNVGIAIVTPAKKVLDLLNSQELCIARASAEERQ
jgi:hypothetical protein